MSKKSVFILIGIGFLLVSIFGIGVTLALVVFHKVAYYRENPEPRTYNGVYATSGQKFQPYHYGVVTINTGKPQGFPVPKGMTYIAMPVEDRIVARLILNGDRDGGIVDLKRIPDGSPERAKEYHQKEALIKAVSFIAQNGYGGTRIAYCTFPIGYPPPSEDDSWIGEALLLQQTN